MDVVEPDDLARPSRLTTGKTDMHALSALIEEPIPSQQRIDECLQGRGIDVET